MKTHEAALDDIGYRYPLEIIPHAVWLSGCISAFLSVFGSVEELMAQRGIVVTYETVRQWCLKFGQIYSTYSTRWPMNCAVVVLAVTINGT